MGTVWRARDEVLGRQVAVKRLHVSPQLDADELAMRHERTTREAQAAARINHPNVVGVHDVVDDAGLPCIVMEYVPSSTLGDAIKEAARENRSVPPREAARIGRGMIAALRAAHAAGVLHRDVKPGNVLLGHDGRVVLTDFGIAVATGTSTLTKTGELVGSIDYLAPERVKGGTPGPASDLWALGATLYQAVEGRPPFRKSTAVETAYAIAMDPLRPPSNAGVLTPLIEALLAKEPEGRPTAEVVEQALRAAESEADTAQMGWPTLALGTVVAGTGPDGLAEAPTGPVAHTAGRAGTGDTGSGTGSGRIRGTGPTAGIASGTGAGTAAGTGTAPGTGSGSGAVTGRVNLADGAGPRGGTSADDRTDVLPSGAPPRKRHGRTMVWSIVGVLVVGGGGGAAWYAMHRDSSALASDPGGTPVQPSVPDNDIGSPPPLPEGFHLVKEKGLGVSFPVPDGWKRVVRDGGRQILYTNNAELAQLTVNALDFSSADQVQHFKEVEADVKKSYPIYHRLRLQDTIYQGDPAAIWEFTFQGKAREFRGIDLGFGREGAKEYAIYVSAPSAGWAKYERYFSHIKDGFRRADPES
ncbi:serine/threonine-protein kinase [Streptomyces sp. NPDC091266]|uniref:serine/threonine-protein kinase n=1 Tax=Streptomyces sp. NPDC091266 TaxID=3365978 RepID=UPI00382BD372